MKPFFFRYVIQDRPLPRTGAVPRVVVIVEDRSDVAVSVEAGTADLPVRDLLADAWVALV